MSESDREKAGELERPPRSKSLDWRGNSWSGQQLQRTLPDDFESGASASSAIRATRSRHGFSFGFLPSMIVSDRQLRRCAPFLSRGPGATMLPRFWMATGSEASDSGDIPQEGD